MTSERQLDIGDVIKLLENVEQYEYVHSPPMKPKAGEAYLFVPACPEEQGGSWLFQHAKIQSQDFLCEHLCEHLLISGRHILMCYDKPHLQMHVIRVIVLCILLCHKLFVNKTECHMPCAVYCSLLSLLLFAGAACFSLAS